MSDLEVKITSITEGMKIDDRGNIIRTKVVVYYIGSDGPFTEEFTSAEFSPELVQSRIEEMRRKLSAIRGIK